jgi:hypothetical protein
VWDSDLMKALLNEQNIKTNNWWREPHYFSWLYDSFEQDSNSPAYFASERYTGQLRGFYLLNFHYWSILLIYYGVTR